jgi:hypothetical protein
LDTALYGVTGPNGVSQCKRDASGNILYQGDWCSSTNAAATSGCADADALAGAFAASSVLITN